MQVRGVGCGLNSDWVANEKSIYSGLFGAPGFEPCGLWVVGPRKRQGSHNRQGQGAGTGSNERLARPEKFGAGHLEQPAIICRAFDSFKQFQTLITAVRG